jgi:hypothetical protein
MPVTPSGFVPDSFSESQVMLNRDFAFPFRAVLAALTAGAALSFSLPSAEADTTLMFGRLEDDEKSISTQRIRIKGKRLSLDGGTDQPYMIFYSGYNRAYVIDHEQRTYLSIDPDKVTKIVDELAASRLQALTDMEAKLATVPAAQKPQMQKMVDKLREETVKMEAAPERKIEYRPTGETVTLAGKEAAVVETFIAGKMAATYFLVPRTELSISDADYEVIQKFAKYLREIRDRLPPSLRSHFAKLEVLAAPNEQIPLKVLSVTGRPEVLIDASDEEIPAGLMNVPASYQPQDLPNEVLQ